MKKILLGAALLAAMGISSNANAQLIDEQNVTITMDLQPILQLNMQGPSNIDFVFDQISEYVGGIVHYGATSLQVSSSVSWDLYAVGYSASGAAFWDQQVIYGGVSGTDNLPLSALEMHQDKANPTALGAATNFRDYNSAFLISPVVTGRNCIYTSATPYVKPADGEKYIAGGQTLLAFVAGGSYLVQGIAATYGSGGSYYYTIDYRIVPGLPATFPNAATNAGVTAALVAPAFAQPGVYTMNVKYVLVENQ